MSSSPPSDTLNVVKDIVASVSASMAQTYAGQPLGECTSRRALTKPAITGFADTIKVRMQGSPMEFRNPIHCFLSTVQKEGVLSLW
jgi:hypothetical protein